MNRTEATKFLREVLDRNGLDTWKIRLTTDLTRGFLGMCSYRDRCIILNAHHIDTHGEKEVINTIYHEVAHALCVGDGHGPIWKAKAIELGCDNPVPCVHYSFDENAIDAIRSGAQVEVEYEERIVREPKYKISRLQNKCIVCGKVAKEKSRKETRTSQGRKVLITYECGHFVLKNADSHSDFEDIVFDGNPDCKHDWNGKTVCVKCNAKKLFPYQIEGARSLEKANGRLAIFDEMGLGKTIQALAYLHFHQKDAWPFLWVTKSGIKYQHAREIVRVLGERAIPQILMSGKDTLVPKMNAVVSYDIFRRLDLDMFIKHGFKTIVLDECQAIKNPDSSRTQCIRTIARDIPKIIPLSGTPWKNRGSEFFVVLNMLDPAQFHSYKSFVNRWVNFYWDKNKQKEGGIADPKAFKEAIAHIAIRRERVEVMPELPLISRTHLLTEVPEHARKVYKEEQDKLIKTYNDFVIDGKEDSFEAHQAMMASLIVMRQILGIAKVPQTVEFVQEFLEDTDRKIVVFVHHKKCGELIASQMKEYCKTEGLAEPLVLTADLNGEERFNIQQKFNSPDYRLLIASTLASGEGLNLQTCSDCVMHERQWNPANEEQAEGRFIRIGQKAQHVTATYVHADNSIDIDLDALVESKRREFHKTMNNAEMVTWNEQSLVKDLVASIAGRKK